MMLEFNTVSRDDFIALGHKLGKAIRDIKRSKAWTICVNGDNNSGKELLALAVDRAFNPSLYPDGITRDMKAEEMLDPGPFPSSNIVFTNFRRLIQLYRQEFDQRLESYAAQNPGARVLIASNIERTIAGEFDYFTHGLDSDRLDISLIVHKERGDFTRKVAFTADDLRVLVAMVCDTFRLENSPVRQEIPSFKK